MAFYPLIFSNQKNVRLFFFEFSTKTFSFSHTSTFSESATIKREELSYESYSEIQKVATLEFVCLLGLKPCLKDPQVSSPLGCSKFGQSNLSSFSNSQQKNIKKDNKNKNEEKRSDYFEKRKNYLQWDEYFMAVALLSAQRSKDPSTQV